MSSATPSVSFDFNPLAARFDRFLPQIHPVGLAVLDRLPAPVDGGTVLDVACGTGEPGLTLARRARDVRVLGVDQAEALLEVARGKATHEGLANTQFEAMPMDALTLPDASVDAVVSRFGLLMFGDVVASARELARVLRDGGAFSLAVWDDPAKNTLMSALLRVLEPHLPPGRPSPMEGILAWSGEERRTRLLAELGLTARTEMFAWTYGFERFDEPWDKVSSMGSFTGQATLAPAAQEQVRQGLSAALAPYRQSDGRYEIPHACRLIWGERATTKGR
jgi:SAM-dependent methyltransferase